MFEKWIRAQSTEYWAYTVENWTCEEARGLRGHSDVGLGPYRRPALAFYAGDVLVTAHCTHLAPPFNTTTAIRPLISNMNPNKYAVQAKFLHSIALKTIKFLESCAKSSFHYFSWFIGMRQVNMSIFLRLIWNPPSTDNRH